MSNREALDPFAATAFAVPGPTAAPAQGHAPVSETVVLGAKSGPPPPARVETLRPRSSRPRSLRPERNAVVGRVVKGRYKLNCLIGEGGMGGVYEAEHIEIGRRVALKLVHGLHARDRDIAARIKQEARSTSAIDSENIVQVFDAGEDEEFGVFLVMELLKGEDLSALLERKNGLPPREAATIAMQAAQGLARAHAAGIIHRDLKPANVFLCVRDDGSPLVKLVDFGIAKLVRDAQGVHQSGLTRAGVVIGTPQYMSPEQAQGLATVDHRTDIYSLGSVLFEMIAGKPAYPEMPTYEQTILQIMTCRAPRLSQLVPNVHPDLDQLCAEMMAHDPGSRPSAMTMVRERLARVLPDLGNVPLPATGSHPIALHPQTRSAETVDSEKPIADVPGVPRRRGTALYLGLAAAATLGLVAGSLIVVKISRPAPPSSDHTKSGYGLVQPTPASVAPPITVIGEDKETAVPALSVAKPIAAVAASAAALAPPAAPTPGTAFASPTTKPGGGGATTGAKGRNNAPRVTPNPTGALPPSVATEKARSTSRPVGGTGVTGWDDDVPAAQSLSDRSLR